jgi:hypothetical protein
VLQLQPVSRAREAVPKTDVSKTAWSLISEQRKGHYSTGAVESVPKTAGVVLSSGFWFLVR